jgi:ribokinase
VPSPAAPLRLFVSSTSKDLEGYRDDVDGLVRRFGHVFVGMEYFGARRESPLETCLDEVSKSDVVLVIVGSRYGTLSPDKKRSYTEREVKYAGELGLPVLVFIQDDVSFESDREARLRERFVSRLGQYTHARFTGLASLLTEVSSALHRLIRDDVGEGSPDAWREIVERASSAADFDCVAISAQNVDRIYVVDRIVSDYETRAGAAIVRPGGSGANTMVGVRRLGMKVAVAGIVGSAWDGPGVLRAALYREGVKILFAPTGKLKEETGTTMTFIDPEGRRSIFVEPGINERFAQAAKNPHFRRGLMEATKATRILHMTSFTRSPELVFQAATLPQIPDSTIVSVTPGALYCRLGLDRLEPLVLRANVLFLTVDQLNVLLDHERIPCKGSEPTLREKLDCLFAWRARRGSGQPLAVAVRATEADRTSSDLMAAVGRSHVEALIPTNGAIGARGEVVDSTGAGDATAAGFLAAIISNYSLPQALDAGYVLSRSVGAKMGARPGLPNRREFSSRWRSWLGEKPERAIARGD